MLPTYITGVSRYKTMYTACENDAAHRRWTFSKRDEKGGEETTAATHIHLGLSCVIPPMNRYLNTLLFTAVLCLAACNPAPRKSSQKPAEPPFFTETGSGSHYSNVLAGRKTASGGRYSRDGFTAAHPSLPFGTIVKVTNIDNGLSVKVEIDDRGPHAKGRIIDLSSAAAKALQIQDDGVVTVKLEAFKTDQARAAG